METDSLRTIYKEWLPSLPLHLDIYASLDLPPPQFGHLPLLLNRDGSKMSKRHGDVSVGDYIVRSPFILLLCYNRILTIHFQAQGWLPQAVLNWLALAGWGSGSDSSKNVSENQRKSKVAAPESTEMLTLTQLIDKAGICISLFVSC